MAQTLLYKEGGGRVAAHEIMVGTNAVRNLIRENQLAQIYSMIQTGSRYGMQTMEDSVNDLVTSGLISEETAHNALKSGAEDTDEQATGAPPAGAAQKKAPPPPPEKKTSSMLSGMMKKPEQPPEPAPTAAEGDEPDGGYSF